MFGIELSIMAAMVLINALFAAYEIALATISVSRLETLVAERRKGAGAALRMRQNLEGSLAVVQLAITLVGAVAAATGGAGAEERIVPLLRGVGMSESMAEVIAIGLVVVPLTALTIVLGELFPKLFALRNKQWVCLQLSPVMSWFSMSVWPAVWALETSAKSVTRMSERLWRPREHPEESREAAELQDLRALAGLARTARLIGPREEGIIVNAARLSTRPVSEIVLPAEHIRMLGVHDKLADCLSAAHLDMHTRFPVAESADDPQTIVGYVNFKDIAAHLRSSPADDTLQSIRRIIPSMPSDCPIASALESLMRQRTHIAIVRDKEQRVLGMVTLEDIFEELVGDIQDEYDLLPVYALPAGDGWIVGGGISITGLRELTQIDLLGDLPSSGARTLSGWVAGHLGRTVAGGEIVERGGVRIVVRKVRRHQVLEALLQHATQTRAGRLK